MGSKTTNPPARQSPTAARTSKGGSPAAQPWPLKALREGNPVLLGVLLAALIFATYLPSLGNGFVNIDDQVYVYANAHVQEGLTWSGLRWATTATVASMWSPVTWVSLMLDTEMFGKTPSDYHRTNLLLHTANTVLLFLLLLRLTRARWRSAMVAALFGVHPLHVESVAWIAERKDVLSTFFFLLTLWAYVRYAGVVRSPQSVVSSKEKNSDADTRRSQALRFYGLAITFYALGLLSKPMLVTTPILMLLLDYWPLRRLDFHPSKNQSIQQSTSPSLHHSITPSLRLLWEKAPFFLLALGCGVVTMFAQRGAGSFMTATDLPVHHRLDNALLTCVHYLVQTFWPGHYAFYYPYPHGFSTAAVVLAVLILLAITVAAVWNWQTRPYLAFGWAWYLVTLLPVIGLIQVGGQAQADRYTYIPLIGIFLLLTWGIAGFIFSRPAIPATQVCWVAGCLVVGVCIPFTRQQIGYWHDGGTLAHHALEVTHDNAVALNIYGIALSKEGQLDEAIACWKEAVRIAPSYAHALGNLGAAYLKKGQFDTCIQYTSAAIKAKPELSGAYSNLGAALGSKGRLDEAITALKEAVQLAPGDAQTHYNLGYAFEGKGRYDEAIAQYEETLRLAPAHEGARQRLQIAMAAKDHRK